MFIKKYSVIIMILCFLLVANTSYALRLERNPEFTDLTKSGQLVWLNDYIYRIWYFINKGYVMTPLTGSTTLTDEHRVAICDGTFTVTLPRVTPSKGKNYHIKNIGTGVITVDADGTETIDGETTQTLNQWDCMNIVSDGSEWYII